MDIARVKKLTYGKIALWGNVNTILLQDGTKQQIKSSAMYCLESASPGGGYIFGASNTIFKGAKLELYHEMFDVYHQFNRNIFAN
jgi:uroporphyrinogen-III decarboxylase